MPILSNWDKYTIMDQSNLIELDDNKLNNILSIEDMLFDNYYENGCLNESIKEFIDYSILILCKNIESRFFIHSHIRCSINENPTSLIIEPKRDDGTNSTIYLFFGYDITNKVSVKLNIQSWNSNKTTVCIGEFDTKQVFEEYITKTLLENTIDELHKYLIDVKNMQK